MQRYSIFNGLSSLIIRIHIVMLPISANKLFNLPKIEWLSNTMQIFNKVNEVQDYLTNFNTKSVGFVATMGALHQGHLSLIEISKNENDLTVCSIFVNPKQFNNPEDLIKYPRNIELDLSKLEKSGCDVVFMPSVDEIYPSKIQKEFNFGLLSEVMEARHRPGHFNGVALVIERFFEILNPNIAYFGEKDIQQLAIIKDLVKQLNLSVKIVGCPIFREENGLAMSSRNERLSALDKQKASLISRTLFYIIEHRSTHTIAQLKDHFLAEMNNGNSFGIEYFEIADKETLKPIENWSEAEHVIACTAVNIGGVRLIDNMTFID